MLCTMRRYRKDRGLRHSLIYGAGSTQEPLQITKRRVGQRGGESTRRDVDLKFATISGYSLLAAPVRTIDSFIIAFERLSAPWKPPLPFADVKPVDTDTLAPLGSFRRDADGEAAV